MVSFKSATYFAIIFILLLVSVSVLLIYYTQDFDENFTFKQTISFSDIEIQTTQRSAYGSAEQVRYLSSAKASVGEVRLKNEGIFAQAYTFPRLIGCLNFVSEAAADRSQIQVYQFSVLYLPRPGSSFNDGRSGSTEIRPGESMSFDLLGEYNSWNVPLSSFNPEEIASVSIYMLDERLDNPVRNLGYDAKYNKYSSDCKTARATEPLATIQLG